jgi:hypothetical protein
MSQRSLENKRRCYICFSKEHKANDCPKKPSLNSEIHCEKRSEFSENKASSAKMARYGKWYSNVSLTANNFQGWIIDSGASTHMCCNRNLFSNLKSGQNGEILITNGKEHIMDRSGLYLLLAGSSASPQNTMR